jgi:hypothetical protein
VPGPEITPAPRLVLLDLHVRIAKGHTLNFVSVHDINDGLLFAMAGFTLANAARLIQSYFATFVRSH